MGEAFGLRASGRDQPVQSRRVRPWPTVIEPHSSRDPISLYSFPIQWARVGSFGSAPTAAPVQPMQ
jgi:hypothetical protein